MRGILLLMTRQLDGVPLVPRSWPRFNTSDAMMDAAPEAYGVADVLPPHSSIRQRSDCGTTVERASKTAS